MRRCAAWLVTLPIALVGVATAHAYANAAFGSPEGPGEVFASPASGSDVIPVLSAAALALVLAGLGARAAGRWWLPRGARLLALPFACLPPVAFVLLELVEALLHRGSIPGHLWLEPALLAGLVLQLPFALAGYVVARVLLRLSDGVRSLVLRRRAAPRLESPPPPRPRPPDPAPRPARRCAAHLARAPPAGLRVPG